MLNGRFQHVCESSSYNFGGTMCPLQHEGIVICNESMFESSHRSSPIVIPRFYPPAIGATKASHARLEAFRSLPELFPLAVVERINRHTSRGSSFHFIGEKMGKGSLFNIHKGIKRGNIYMEIQTVSLRFGGFRG